MSKKLAFLVSKLTLAATLALALALTFSCSSGGGGSLSNDSYLVNAVNEAWIMCEGEECVGFIFKQNGEWINVSRSKGGDWNIQDGGTYSIKGNEITSCSYGYGYEGCEVDSYSISGNTFTLIYGNNYLMTFTRTNGVYINGSGGGNNSGGGDSKLVCADGEAWLENNGNGEQGFVFKSNGNVIQLEQCANGWCIDAEYKWKTQNNHIIWYIVEGGEEEDEGPYTVSGNTLEIMHGTSRHTFTKKSGIYPVPKAPKSSSSVARSSSGSVMFNSSSSVPRSSSSGSVVASGCDVEYISGTGCNISGYRTVVIGSQTWMAENLNCDVAGSVCYDKDPANCEKYGRLYDWNTANTVCPSGWHLPTDADWDVLMTAVGGEYTAGTKLKAKSGWCYNGQSYNGTDDYRFSALPGGIGGSGGGFIYVGSFGYWWSATEYDASNAYKWDMSYGYAFVFRYYTDKSGLYSVRCVKNN